MLPLGMFLLLSGLFLYPLSVRPGSLIPANVPHAINDDTVTHVWYWWYLKDNLAGLFSKPGIMFQTTKLYFPFGLNLMIALGNPIPLILLFPLVGWLPFPCNSNLYVAGIILLNALAVYYLLRRLKFGKPASILGSALVLLNPYYYLTASGGRGEQAIIALAVLAIPPSLDALCRGSRRRILAAAAWVFVASLFYWFHGVFLCITLALAVLLLSIRAPRGRRLYPAKRFLALLMLLFALSLPLLYPQIKEGMSKGHVLGLTSGNIVPLKLPPGEEEMGTTGSRLTVDSHSPAAILRNAVAVFQLLLIIPVVISRKRPTFWIVLVLLFYLFSLGPYLHLPWLGTRLILPYALLYALVPFCSRILSTGRFNAFTYMALALTAAYSFKYISMRLNLTGRRQIIVLGFCLALTVFLARTGDQIEFSSAPVIPDGIHHLSGQAGGVIDVPVLSNEIAPLAMWYQTAHGGNLLTGPGPALWFQCPGELKTLIEENRILKYLARFGLEHDKNILIREVDFEDLRKRGFKYIIHHKQNFLLQDDSQEIPGARTVPGGKRNGNSLHWRRRTMKLARVLGRSPVYQDNAVDIFDIGQSNGQGN